MQNTNSWENGNQHVSTSNAPAHCLRKCQHTAQEGRTQRDRKTLTKMKRQNSEFKEANAGRILWIKIITRRMLHRDKDLETNRGAEYWSVNTRENTTKGKWKKN